MKILLASLILLAGCPNDNKIPPQKRENRAVQVVQIINKKAECLPISNGLEMVAQPDTAYCALGDTVYFCTAGLTTPIECKVAGKREPEKAPTLEKESK